MTTNPATATDRAMRIAGTADATRATRRRGSGPNVPADGLLHPALLGAVALMIVNDHGLKAAFPGLLTGKLSDVAGLLFFPALLIAIAELGAAVARREWRHGRTAVMLACAATGLGFAIVKLTAEGAFAFGWVIGHAQWLLGQALAAATGGSGPPPGVALIVNDASDLAALVALVPAALIGRRRAASLRRGGAAR